MYQKVILIGKLGKDPKIKQTKNSQVANLSVATWHSNFNEKTQSWEQITQWHNVTVWGKAVKAIEKLTKGDYVMVDGELQTSEWQNEDGETQKNTAIVGFVKGIRPPQKFDTSYQYSQETRNHKPEWTPDNEEAQPAGTSTTYSSDNGDDLPF